MFQSPPNLQFFFAVLKWENIQKCSTNSIMNIEVQARNMFVQSFSIFIKLFLDSFKGKAVPLQAWSGPEGSGKLRFPDFMTTAQEGGEVVSLTHRPPLPPGKAPGTRFC